MRQPEDHCDHDWQTFRQSVPIENLNFKGSDAYFIVNACLKCHIKVPVDYRIDAPYNG